MAGWGWNRDLQSLIDTVKNRVPELPQQAPVRTAVPVGEPSGIIRPGVPVGASNAVEVPVNPRNLPVPTGDNLPAVRSSNLPVPDTNRGFQLGAGGQVEVETVGRPVQAQRQIAYNPLENIDAEVRSRIGKGSGRASFVGPQPAGAAPVSSVAPVRFGGVGGAQVIDPSGGLVGELYRRASKATGRYIPGIEQMWGGQPNADEWRQGVDAAYNQAVGQAVPVAKAPTMSPSRTPGEVVDVDPTRGKLGGMFGFNKEGAAAPGGDTMLLGGAGARSYQTPMYAADIAKSLGVTDPARMAKNDWSDGSVNQKLAMQQADNAVAHERHLRNMADVEKLRNNRSLQEHFNELLYSRNTLGMPQSAMWELAGKNFAAQQGRNKIAGDLEVARTKGEFGMKAKADDLEIRRLDREAKRESALEVAALKAKENRETTLGVTKLKMDESRTERELAAEKELRKGKMELAVPDATTAGTDIETAIAAREMGLEARGVKKNMFGSITEPAGFYDRKTGKLVDAATIKGRRGKTTGSSAADIAASLRSQGKTTEQIKAELIAQGFKPGTR